jgi:hypothetical protein
VLKSRSFSNITGLGFSQLSLSGDYTHNRVNADGALDEPAAGQIRLAAPVAYHYDSVWRGRHGLLTPSLPNAAGSTSSARWSMQFAIVNNRFRQAGHPGVDGSWDLNLLIPFRVLMKEGM